MRHGTSCGEALLASGHFGSRPRRFAAWTAPTTVVVAASRQYTDMIRTLAEGSNTNTILLPHSPSSVGDIMSQIRDGILIADVATETNAQPRAIAPRVQAA